MSKFTKSVVVSDVDGRLSASLFASREGVASAVKVPDFDSGRAVKVSSSESFGAADWVVRSVVAGKRRLVEVVFGVVPASVARAIFGFEVPGSTSDEAYTNTAEIFRAGDRIWLTDGLAVATVPNAVPVNC